MKKTLLCIIVGLLTLPVCAQETQLAQTIDNEKSHANINLNSQIKPDSAIEKQSVNNKGSWFNVNINRNTYKLYCTQEQEDNK